PRNDIWLENILRLALESSDVYPDLGVRPVGYLDGLGDDSCHFKDLVFATKIVILQQAKSQYVAFGASASIARLAMRRYADLEPKCPRPMPSATEILAIAP